MFCILIMIDTHLRAVDLNLLPVLDALLRYQHVSRAAQAVGLTQPAASRALARLRHLLNDPLLVRSGGKLVLTARADSLRAALSATLASVQDLLRPESFDPATERRTLRLAMTDVHSTLLLPRLLARLAKEAPGVKLVAQPITAATSALVAAGDIDLALAVNTTPLPPGARSTPLLRDRLAVAMRHDHPAGGREWGIEDYSRFPSVTVAILGDGVSELDAELSRVGVERRILATVPHFATALAMVAATDAVITMSRAFATHFTAPFGLVLKEPPLASTDFGVVMVWGVTADTDPLLRWARQLLVEVGED
jgi:DNA-binding transcriptional LysR family regulator